MKLMLVEPPKDYWFLMGEYLPPPATLLVLAAYIERELPKVEISVLDSQAEGLNWSDIRRKIESEQPDVVASSGFTCNAYACARVMEEAKRVNEKILTVVGGQHFSAIPEASLQCFPEIDCIVRGEGEQSFTKLLQALSDGTGISGISGISFRKEDKIFHNPDGSQIEQLDELPYPAYHLVRKNLGKYHFSMMAGKNTRYLIMEGSRGCSHSCEFCTQWRHWNKCWRTKSPRRIAEEMAFLVEEYGGQFLWLTDDNFDYGKRGRALATELEKNDPGHDISWFFQARVDDVASHPDTVASLRKRGNTWILLGIESGSQETLDSYRKGFKTNKTKEALEILRESDVFTQGMFVIGSRKDTHESIAALRKYSISLGLGLAIYTVLTPFPGTSVYDNAKSSGWIGTDNWAMYDMAHAIMPTETLTRRDVQEELFKCYRAFYGSTARGILGVMAGNKLKRRAYRHMMGKFVLSRLKELI